MLFAWSDHTACAVAAFSFTLLLVCGYDRHLGGIQYSFWDDFHLINLQDFGHLGKGFG
jgi:hypothetical protein